MTRRLTRLADIAYRRRGRMVLGWIVATVVIIGVGSSLAGEYNADYDTPGSESKAASDLTEQRFGGYSGQEIYVVWKDPAGADEPRRATQRIDAFFAEAEQVDHVARAHADPRLAGRQRSARRTLPLTVPGWDVTKEDGEKLIDAAEANSGDGLEIKLGGDPIYAAQEPVEPGGARLPRRRDRAADRLRLGGRRRPAARDRAGRPRHLLRRPDRPARERRRRPRLDDRGLGPDRDRGRDRLLAARPDPLPLGDGRRQGPPRRGGRGGHHRRAQRDHRRLHRGDRRPRPVPDRPPATCTASRSRPRWPCWS